MIAEIRQEIVENEITLNRWKDEILSKILSRNVLLPESAAKAFYKIIDECTDAFSGKELRERIDGRMPDLWKLVPPPKNETEWKQYFNDLETDCAIDQCVTINEVWQIIGYDTAEFERMRGSGFTFVQAFTEMYLEETDEQQTERTKDLTLEQYKERIEHAAGQVRESMTESARLRNEAFKKFGVNVPLENVSGE